jgi:uncharacterized membrane protein YukC
LRLAKTILKNPHSNIIQIVKITKNDKDKVQHIFYKHPQNTISLEFINKKDLDTNIKLIIQLIKAIIHLNDRNINMIYLSEENISLLDNRVYLNPLFKD